VVAERPVPDARTWRDPDGAVAGSAWARRATLAPLAHMAWYSMGEGVSEFRASAWPGREAFAWAASSRLALPARRKASRWSTGTQAMLAVGCLELAAAECLDHTGKSSAL